MSKLAKEYTDIKDIRHKVEHLVVSPDDKHSREQIVEELLCALTKQKKHIPA